MAKFRGEYRQHKMAQMSMCSAGEPGGQQEAGTENFLQTAFLAPDMYGGIYVDLNTLLKPPRCQIELWLRISPE